MATGIKRLELYNYRCHRHCIVSPDQRHVIISGANGSGKSSLLEAISLASPGRGLRNAKYDALARQPTKQGGWRTILELEGDQSLTIINACLPHQPTRQLTINDQPARQLELADWLRILWLTPLMDRIWTEPADRRRALLDRMTMSLFPEHPVHVNRYDRALRERNQLLRDGVMDHDWLTSLEIQLADQGATIAQNRRSALAAIQRALDSTVTGFPTATLAVQQSETQREIAEDPKALKSHLLNSRLRDQRAGRTLSGAHRADLTVHHTSSSRPASHCSTGEQKSLLIAIVLANARAVATRSDMFPILLLDEAVAHLDPELRTIFLDEICTLDTQVWITCTDVESLLLHDHRFQHLWLPPPDNRHATFRYSHTG
ncbi:MAG: DNA replication/repair protein RecF [Rhodobacteraceae bacterium]|nr:DNA replication/repair protein RecF [Paracoccaceae bacterium]